MNAENPRFTKFDRAAGFVRDLLAGFGGACVTLWVLYFFWWK